MGKDYITAAQAAVRWGVTTRRVQQLCRNGRITLAKRKTVNGRSSWLLPASDKPEREKPGPKKEGHS